VCLFRLQGASIHLSFVERDVENMMC